ncbi:DUF7530 family protein [Saliphagus infecundisoli]|uniref:Uncharacterized protein n=1 Tax=Saliphagus infecundisoli TaxID=1849069 RepID=A0ABD5QKB6_9EURY|nr:hypothetical protein [Saliphagus infecundisoli]
MEVEYGETWVYESIVGALPGVDLPDRVAVAIQLAAFEAAILVVAAVYGLWTAVPAGTAAVAVAAAGSWFMLRYSRETRTLKTPPAYRQVLFGSSIEVVLGVVAFVALITYLFVYDPATTGESLVTELFGPKPPPLAVGLALLVLWDVVYRIGTCWWASVASLWRAYRYAFDADETRRLVALDARNVGFAAVQLLFVPFVADRPLLLWALCGHVLAVACVSGLAIVRQRAVAG